MNAVAEIAALWLKRGLALLRSVGPYAVIEILLPGGTLIALLLWLSRRAASRSMNVRPVQVETAQVLFQPIRVVDYASPRA